MTACPSRGSTWIDWRDTKLTGTVTAAESGTLFLSIPYDEGWTITIDGQPAEGEKILEAFLSVPVEAGTHEISLTYMPGGLIPGVVISGSSLAVLALLRLVKRRRSGPLPGRRIVPESLAPYGKNRRIPDTRRFFSVLISIWKGEGRPLNPVFNRWAHSFPKVRSVPWSY